MPDGAVLVVGSTGRVGSELVRQLRTETIQTFALVRHRDRGKVLEDLGAELREGDLSNPESLKRAIEGVDRAVLAAPNKPEQVEWYENFVDVASRNGAIHIVKVSGFTSSVSAPAIGHRIHGQTDDMLRSSNHPCTIVRPNVFNQNILWHTENIRLNNRFSLPAGNALISMIDVVDIAAAVKTILLSDKHMEKTYDLTGPEALSYHHVAKILSNVTGRTIKYEPMTFEASVKKNEQLGLSKWEARKRAETQSLFGTGVFAPITDDLPPLLDRPPKRFEEFAKDHKPSFC